MSVQFHKNKEMILDCKRNGQIMVIDFNFQGVVELDTTLSRFKQSFPELYGKHLKLITSGDMKTPSFHLTTVDGFDIAIIYGQTNRVGNHKDTSEEVCYKTLEILKNLFKKTGLDKRFVSGIMYRNVNAMPYLVRMISAMGIKWDVYCD